MIHELSILIPTRNDVCLSQVETLQRLATAVDSLHHEILVADDASTDADVLRQNAGINELPNCRLLLQERNLGRAANRNYLARQARYDWLLYLDCNVKIPDEHFLLRYLEAGHSEVINGGIFAEDDPSLRHNLRYQYEKKIESQHIASQRAKRPYQSFRTSNFMIRRQVMLDHPLDETITGYGYEDVLFGKALCEQGIPIQHIDNPVVINHFEANEAYLAKVEEAMRTLHTLQDRLAGYSPLLDTVESLRRKHLIPIYQRYFNCFGKRMRAKLIGDSPSIRWLNPYKLGYYLSIVN